jgi:hypothetical protein
MKLLTNTQSRLHTSINYSGALMAGLLQGGTKPGYSDTLLYAMYGAAW